MRIYHNISALNAYNNLSKTTNFVNKSLEKLSSGLRINRAADDAAGLAISEKMRAQVRGLDQAIRNAQDGISLIQTAEGALNETHSILQRMRELAVQASNDTNTASDRQAIQAEIDQLVTEIDRIAVTTEFNTKKLLDGSTSAIVTTDKLTTKVFMRDGLRTIDEFGLTQVGGGSFQLEITATPGTNHVQRTNVMRKMDGTVATAATTLREIAAFYDNSGNFLVTDPQTITIVQGDGKRAEINIFGSDTISAIESKLNDAIANQLGQSDIISGNNFVTYVTAAGTGFQSIAGTFVIRSAITGDAGKLTFIADENIQKALGLMDLQEATNNQFTVDITNAINGSAVATGVKIEGNMLVGAVHPNVDVKFDNMTDITVAYTASAGNFTFTAAAATASTFIHMADNTMVFQIGANPNQDVAAGIGDMRAEALGVDNILVTSREAAIRSLTQIDSAINRVSSERAKMGALQNRLDHTINNLTVASENLNAAESRIRDVDMAKEMMEYTKWTILSQAGNAMLAQANQRPQMVLQLLGS